MYFIGQRHLIIMKKALFIITALSLSLLIFGQHYKGVKLYAYSQIVIPGVAPRDVITESGNPLPVERKQRKNTWIYLTYPVNIDLKQCELYIKGVRYNFQAEYVVKTPVTYTDYNIPDFPKTIELVPKSENKVLRLTPLKQLSSKPSTHLKKLFKENELVVSYTVKGRKYYSVLKNFIVIEPAVAS